MGKTLAEEATARVAQEPETQKNKEGSWSHRWNPLTPGALGPVPDLCCSGKYNRGPIHSRHAPVEPTKSSPHLTHEDTGGILKTTGGV